MQAARKGDSHECAEIGPNMGSDLKIIEGSPNIFIGGKPAARVGDKVSCRMALTESPTIEEGSSSVFFNGKPAARMGDRIKQSGSIKEGASNVLIGDDGCLVTIGDNVLVTIDDQCMIYINAPSSDSSFTAATTQALEVMEMAKANVADLMEDIEEAYRIEKSIIENFANESLEDEANDILAPLGPEIGAVGGKVAAGIVGAIEVVKTADAVQKKDIEKCKNVLEFGSREDARKALSGDLQKAANRFFRKATGKSSNFKIIALENGGYRFQFFSEAENSGYGKFYMQEVDENGTKISSYKDTIGPDGIIERKTSTGEDM